MLIMAVLVLSCTVLVSADHDSLVPPAGKLDVYITSGGSTTLLHSYSLDDMRNMANNLVAQGAIQNTVSYSSIDAMPARVLTVAHGVDILDLLADLQNYVTDPAISIDAANLIKFTATDGYRRSYTYTNLIDTDRYYYPAMFSASSWNSLTGTVSPGDVQAGATLVQPMLAVTSYQYRTDMETQPSQLTEADIFRFCIGMTPGDLISGNSTTSSYIKGVYRIDIFMDANVPLDIGVSGLTIDKDDAEIEVGSTVTLTAKVVPDDATNKNVVWTSSDQSVATVDGGVVTGVGAGSAVITATSIDGGKNVTCDVTVKTSNVAVTGITINDAISLSVGKSRTLTAVVAPYNATNSAVTWSSDNTIVATVSDGKVLGVSPGTANITVTTVDGGFTDSCKITVLADAVRVTGVTMNRSSLSLAKGESDLLIATVTPSNASDNTVLWSSDTPGVAAVDTSGVVTAKGAGTAVISAVTDDGNFTAECTVTVTKEREAVSFSDISGNWAEDSIKKLAALGVVTGGGDGTFRPEATITRAEFVTMLIRAMMKTDSVVIEPGNTFDDISSHWASGYISTAVSLGIVSGCTNNTFKPDDNITREQIALIIVNAYKLKVDTTQISTYPDDASISAWAKSAVEAALSNCILAGCPDGNLNPQKAATRAEAVSIIVRIMERLGKI